MRTMEDNTYAPLLAAVLRARERLNLPGLAVAVRGERAALVVRIPGVPGASGRGFTYYVTPFTLRACLDVLEEAAERLTPARVAAHLTIAVSVARTGERYLAAVEALAKYRLGAYAESA